MNAETKALTQFSIKNADQGTVEAVFASRLVRSAAMAAADDIDLGGDVTLKGAFTDSAQVVISAYGHSSWGQGGPAQLPVGKGIIREVGDQAILTGQFFLDTELGEATFTTVKAMGSLQEWSYSLQNVRSKRATVAGRQVRVIEAVDVKEVSPVLMGEGIETRTLATKSASASSTGLSARWTPVWLKDVLEMKTRLDLHDIGVRCELDQIADRHAYRYSLAGPPDAKAARAAEMMINLAARDFGISSPPLGWIVPAKSGDGDLKFGVDIAGVCAEGNVLIRADRWKSIPFGENLLTIAHEVRHAAGGDEAEAVAYEAEWSGRLGLTSRSSRG